MLTKNIETFQFLCTVEGPCIPTLNDILLLIHISQDLQWEEGICSLLSSSITQKHFILASYDQKVDFCLSNLSQSSFDILT